MRADQDVVLTGGEGRACSAADYGIVRASACDACACAFTDQGDSVYRVVGQNIYIVEFIMSAYINVACDFKFVIGAGNADTDITVILDDKACCRRAVGDDKSVGRIGCAGAGDGGVAGEGKTGGGDVDLGRAIAKFEDAGRFA